VTTLSFSNKRTGETITLSWEFVNDLVSGETITDATLTATVESGTDPNPENIVSGTPTVSGSVVAHDVTGGVEGVKYLLLMSIDTSTGQTLELPAFLTVTDET